jgi:hypothetical protein
MHERVGRKNDLITGADAYARHRTVKCGGSAVHHETVFCTDPLSELLFQCICLGHTDRQGDAQVPAAEHFTDCQNLFIICLAIAFPVFRDEFSRNDRPSPIECEFIGHWALFPWQV